MDWGGDSDADSMETGGATGPVPIAAKIIFGLYLTLMLSGLWQVIPVFR